MDLQELRQEAIKIIKANPELKPEIQDLFSLAISEVEEGGSESHECDLAYNDMIELQNEANNNKMVKGGKLTGPQQAKFDKVMSEWKAGKLHSGSSDGPIVKDQDQAIAIAYAQANSMKKMEFGGLVYDSLSDEAKDRMEGLVPIEQMNNVLSNCRYIVSDMMEEGFELDEAISFIVYKIVDDFTDKRMGYFSEEYYPEDWKETGDSLGRPQKPKILIKLHDKLKEADNLESLIWEFNDDEGWSIVYENGLESLSDYHRGELESYAFYANDKGLIDSVYLLNGHDSTDLTMERALSGSRAFDNTRYDKMKTGGKMTGGSVEDDQIEEYAEAIYEDLRQEYKPWELQNMSMEEAMMSVDSYDEIPENLKEQVASYLMNMASQNEFFEEDEEYKDGGSVQSKEEKMIASKAKAIFRDLKRDGYDKFDLAMMTKEEANETVSTFSDVPENLKKEVADYLFMMCQRIPFGQGGSMYNKGGVIENKMQSLENELDRLESELKWTQQQNGASKQYYLRKRRSGKMTRERAMQLIDESNASWKKEREKVREKIKEVKDKIKRLQSLSSKVSADEFSQGGGVDDSKNKKIMESYREWVSDIRNQSYPRMSVSGAVKLASEYMLNSYSRQELIEAIKTDKNIDFLGMEKTWLNALRRAKKPKMANGGGVDDEYSDDEEYSDDDILYKYNEALADIEDWMPNEIEVQDEYFALVESGDIEELASFIEEYADTNTLEERYDITYSEYKALANAAINM